MPARDATTRVPEDERFETFERHITAARDEIFNGRGGVWARAALVAQGIPECHISLIVRAAFLLGRKPPFDDGESGGSRRPKGGAARPRRLPGSRP